MDQRALDLGFWRAEVEGIIKQAMEELYGGIGSNIWNVNILAIEVNPLRAVLAVPSR